MSATASIFKRYSIPYSKTTSRRKTNPLYTEVIVQLNPITGKVTLHDNVTNVLGIPIGVNDIGFKTGQTNPGGAIATWTPDPDDPTKGSWVVDDNTATIKGKTIQSILDFDVSTNDKWDSNSDLLENNVAASINKDFSGDQNTLDKFSTIKGVNSTATGTTSTSVDPESGTGDATPTVDPSTTESFTQSSSNDDTTTFSPGTIGGTKYVSFRYPLDLSVEETLFIEDIIQFSIYSYQPIGITDDNNVTSIGKFFSRESSRNKLLENSKSRGSIYLAIQPSIQDSNNVNWQESGINIVQLGLAAVSSGFIQGGFDGTKETISQLGNAVGNDYDSVRQALNVYFAQQASQTTGLLSRLRGQTLNPNIETLFESPTTRSFSYTFQFSPRDPNEAKMVQKIIKTFKQSMAPRTSPGNLFLNAPYVFGIKYLYSKQLLAENGDRFPTAPVDHPFIGRLKAPLALKSCNVDYAPSGSYMTYPDGSMVQYSVTLLFQEIDPVYFNDYKDLDKETENNIGY